MSRVLWSSKVSVITEPVVVVAMAAALASVGAGMLLKLTLWNTGTVDESPPQAASALAADTEEAKGSKGAPLSRDSRRRRESEAGEMGRAMMNRMREETHRVIARPALSL